MILNINGLNEGMKAEYFKDYLSKNNVQLCFIQETHFDSIEKVNEIKALFNDYNVCCTMGESKTRGVAILIRKSLNITIKNTSQDFESRIINLEIEIEKENYNLVNIYAPNTEYEQIEFINYLYSFLLSKKNVILAGDFNAVTHIKDRTNLKGESKKLKNFEIEWKKLYKNFKLSEINYAHVLERSQKYTWTNGSCSSRIDRIYVSDNLNIKINYEKIDETLRSDHKAVHANIFSNKIKEKSKVSHQWKLNDNILEIIEVKKGIIKICQNIKFYKEKGKLNWYDFFIKKITNFLKYQSRLINNEKKEKLNKLFNSLKLLNENQIKLDDITYIIEKNKIKKEIEEYYAEKNESLKKKYKNDRFEFIKKPTKVLLENINKREINNELKAFQIDTNSEIKTETPEILKLVDNYYTDLLSNKNKEKRGNLENYTLKLNKIRDNSSLNQKITYEETYEVIKSMKDSSPGSNGLSIKFYKLYFPYFGLDYIEILNNFSESLPDNFNETVIKFIPKNDLKVKSIKDTRPLSLTNFEYRIFTKILTNRLKKVSSNLFSDNQTCSVPGRRINDNINLLNDLITDSNRKKTELYLVSIDQRRAFDSLFHDYLFKVIKHLNLGELITQNIIRIYEQSYCYIEINRLRSKNKIKINRSVKQGCSLSMLLYTLCIEEFLISVNLNEKINGFEIKVKKQYNIKTTAYADDIGSINRDIQSVNLFFKEFIKWGILSGASLNEEKTKILAINSDFISSNEIKFVEKLKY